MTRLSFATFLAMLLMLMAGCAYHTSRSESHRTETTRSQEGNADGAELKPGEHSQQSETIRTHQESITTERSAR